MGSAVRREAGLLVKTGWAVAGREGRIKEAAGDRGWPEGCWVVSASGQRS